MSIAPGNSARESLLASAERLFAERGIDAVSLRAINAAAGYSAAALHYHFGSKDELIQQLLEERRGPIVALRGGLLKQLAAAPMPSAADVAATIVRPYSDLIMANNEAGLRTVRFLHRAQQDNAGAPWVRRIVSENYRLYQPALALALPGIDTGTRKLRWLMAQDTALQGLANTDETLANRGLKPARGNRHNYIAQLTSFIAGALSA